MQLFATRHYPAYKGIVEGLSMVYDGKVPVSGQRKDFHDDQYACWLLRKGSLRLGIGQERYVAEQGEWIFVKPNERRTQEFSDDAEILSIRFGLRSQELQLRGVFPYIFRAAFISKLEASALEILKAAEREEVSQGEQEQGSSTKANLTNLSLAKYARVQSAFLSFLSTWADILKTRYQDVHKDQPNTEPDQRMPKLRDLLDAQFGIKPTDYKELEEQLGLSRDHIDRLAKKNLGMSPKAYRERQCFADLSEMLRDHQLPLKTIAQRLGFTDVSHLSNWFEKRSGLRPRAWRSRIEI